MSGCIRQRLGPTKKRLEDRIQETLNFLQQDKRTTHDEIEDNANQLLLKLERNLNSYKNLLEQLQEASKEDETKSQRLENELEAFTILALDGDECICDLEALLKKIVKGKEEEKEREEKERVDATEKEEKQRERVHQKEIQMEKLCQEKEIQMERLKLELEMVRQNEIDKQREHELKKLEVELEAKRKFTQTEREMEIKQTTADLELKIKAEVEQRRLELERQLGTPTTRHSSTIKLPKLELPKFSGNILKWQEFWDSFEASIHKNPNLQPVDKFNYLKAELEGNARAVISGLELTNSNYEVAVSLLQERFGREEIIMDAHYSELMDLPLSSNITAKLRETYDTIEKHLRSLKALGENVDQSHFVFVIKSKLPKIVMARMEEYKDMEEKWTVESIRKAFKRYICAQEAGGRMTELTHSTEAQETTKKSPQQKLFSPKWLGVTTTGALLSGNEEPVNGGQRLVCFYCQKDHWSDECKTYPTLQSRKEKIKGNCFICLRPNHLLRDCKVNKPCFHCQKAGNHHRSLCPKRFPLDEKGETVALVTDPLIATEVESSLLVSGDQVLMQTALADTVNLKTSMKQSTRLLLDCGSQRTYISEDLVKKLQLRPNTSEILTVFTFGSTKPKEFKTPVVEFGLELKNGEMMEIRANVVPKITGMIQRVPINSEQLEPLIKEHQLADSLPKEMEVSTVELLIGNDYYCDLVSSERQRVGPGLYLLGSHLGWILSGRMPTEEKKTSEVSMFLMSSPPCEQYSFIPLENSNDFIKPNLEEFWKLETIGIKEPISVSDDDDDCAIQNFNDTIRKKDGRYEVAWPWKEENPQLPDNYQLALGRLNSLLKRIQGNSELLQKYDGIIQDQLKKEIIEKVDDETEEGSQKHYIPHHAVITPDRTTTKVRIVYDASAKTKKGCLSLNECLYRGPVILEDLSGLLLRFRTHEVALMADIEKAFLQVGLQPPERDVTRFLWLKDPTMPMSKENLQIYRFTRVPFGVISSPFLLGATINHHLEQVGTPTAETIMKHMYVDNLLTGVKSSKEAGQFYSESKEIFQEASMNLREWGSNSKDFLESIPEQDRMKEILAKVLGILWNTDEDRLIVRGSKQPGCSTKRETLKVIATIFDPLGCFTPVILKAKLFLQELWTTNKAWDEKLDEAMLHKWMKIQKEIEGISATTIPRFIGNSNCQLLCFCDASTKAYASVIYLKTDTGINLLFSKSRVAPVKKLGTPRLELLAVLIGVRNLNFVQEQLHLPVNRKFLWTDNQCVLHWIMSKKPLTTFVQNRVKEITATKDINFRYVITSQNPADLATRGVSAQDLDKSELWWHGPKWLGDSEEVWPTWNIPEVTKETLEKIESETKGPKTFYETTNLAGEGIHGRRTDTKEQPTPFGMDEKKYSSLLRLLRITAWALRFIAKVKKEKSNTGELKASEIKEAKTLWIKFIQKTNFSDAFEDKIGVLKKKDYKNQLGILLHEDGLLRCHGRMVNAELPLEAIYPILLPKRSHFSTLLIKEYHQKLFHSGVSHTLAQLRNEYWIPRGRSEVKKAIYDCGTCKRFQGGPFKLPSMSPWPRKKVAKSAPFTYTGLDYLGPLYIQDGTSKRKVWVCLFTCVTVRAIHLELIKDMTAEQFLLGLRRFIARRGKPTQIILDNAPQFKLTKSAVDKAWKETTLNHEVQSYTATQGIEWNFIVELAPWMGGFYERLVGTVKRALKKSIGKVCLTEEKLQTFMTEAEAVINSRPLVYVGEDFNSGFALTPADFLTLNPKTGTPVIEIDNPQDPDYKQDKKGSADKLLELWSKGQQHLNSLWRVWKDDYLLNLRERGQTHVKGPRIQAAEEPRAGSVVLLKDNLPRGVWKMGRVTELIPSQDGKFRAAKILLPTKKVLKRPLNLLYPLECSGSQEVKLTQDDMSEQNKQDTTPRLRPTRAAADRARKEMQRLLSTEIGTFSWLGSVAEIPQF